MKLTFRDLKKQSFSVEAEPSETIADVKKKVADQQGPDFASVRLIYSGKILADSNTIGSYNIKESDHIICMQQKPKAAPVASATPSTPAASAPAQTPAAPAPAAASSTTSAPDTPTPAPSSTGASQTPSERRFDDASPLMLGGERAAAIANMESMGFERPQVERAMRAAFWNPDRAVEYLLNGIPENLAQEAPQRPASGAQRPASAGTGAAAATSPPAAAAAPPATTATPAATAQPSADPSEPVNMFEAAAAANRPGAARTPASGAEGGVAAAAAGLGGAAAGGNLDFLRENPMFQQLRQLVQQQPQMLESVLQQVGASNPALAQMIQQHPDQFIQLLSEGGDGEGGDMPLPPGANNVVSVTEEERDAIERLCRLGFERDLVIQAYFACDKNEELAANFLFDHPDDREGEGGQGEQ
ncbi:MAG: hypothetical protein M1828_007632 [Chrysothrix sp. TS-e1954]|nr:MAG: hypothetical protein M1828_007632 [Chrysothrix sp. TS-e1954]